jgi:hypothetical protein
MSKMIAGVNPLHILEVTGTRFRRHGNHPYLKTIASRCSWHNRVWLYFKFGSDSMFDYPSSARVNFLNSSGHYIKTIDCKSNAEAMRLRDDYSQQLEDFLEALCHNNWKF